MDPITHGLTGYRMAEVGSEFNIRQRLWLLVLGSIMPDIDFFAAQLIDNPLAFLVRRSYTHSFFGITFGSLLVAFLLKRFFPSRSYIQLVGFFFLGSSVHVFMDLINSYGVVLLHPFCAKRFEFGGVFIIDIWMWALLILPWFTRRWISKHKAAAISLTLVSLYILGVMGLHRFSISILDDELSRLGYKNQDRWVFAEPFGPQNFRGAALVGNKWQVFHIRPFTTEIVFDREVLTEDHLPAVVKARQSEGGKKLQSFYAAPVWQETSPGVVEVYDLRFVSLLLDWRTPPFTFRFKIEKNEVSGPVRTRVIE